MGIGCTPWRLLVSPFMAGLYSIHCGASGFGLGSMFVYRKVTLTVLSSSSVFMRESEHEASVDLCMFTAGYC